MRKPIKSYKAKFPFLQYHKRQVLTPGLKIDSQKYFLFQYDSWRLWECLYGNTIPIHLDFEEWGCVLPVMPKNGEHYIGVRNFDFNSCSDYIAGHSSTELKNIAEAGTNWVRDNYSPIHMAQYLLLEVDKLKAKA